LYHTAKMFSMKKMYVLMVVTLFSFGLFAQEAPVWGIKGGLNFATWNPAEKSLRDVVDPRIGFHLGVIAHNHLTHKIAIQPELQFSSQGTERENGANDYDNRMSYINLPVMFQYMFNNGFRVEAGPYVGLLVGAKDVYDDGRSNDAKDEYKGVDAGVGLGLNYLTYSGFGIGGRYNFGLVNVNDRTEGSIQNRVFQLSVFYMFDSDHKRKSR
jgi:hypothetical protein